VNKPKNYRAVMISSTFTDLQKHRQKVIEAVERLGFKANVMESSGARSDLDVLDSSLELVRDSAAYIGIISHKYGQTPISVSKNPNELSITELEFDEAMRLDRPILLFIMSDDHPVKQADVERDAEKAKKLASFRERAKRMREGSSVERVYEVFDSLEQLSSAAASAAGRLTRHLSPESRGEDMESSSANASLPAPPAFVSVPRYLGSHQFVGRRSELDALNDWCKPADPNPMLLFDAMGGSGKSMLTWEWITQHAMGERDDWAGRFWYSFYERGAVMADFCRLTLSYMTCRPVNDFANLRTNQLSALLIAQLEKRPWLLVLDGLERILVAYHRYDAAQLNDEAADTAVDQIEARDPCRAIRDEDDELLRLLTAVAPSKILVSSRLTPFSLMNRSGTAVPGVRRESLQGLRPADAEALMRGCGVRGDSASLQSYLQTNCDCHPLVVGALAGLINNYSPDPANFDKWALDPRHGGALNLAKLNLVQRRNHILQAAVDALSPKSKQLLQSVSLLQGGADFETLKGLNPHLPPEPVETPRPDHPSDEFDWDARSAKSKNDAIAKFQSRLEAWKESQRDMEQWTRSDDVAKAHEKLNPTIHDLEVRGLLQYDHGGMRYDLHPVVRGVTSGSMRGSETIEFGQKVVDYFSSQPHTPWENAETLDDLASGLQIVRVLIRMGKYDDALQAFMGDLANALDFNLNERKENQAIVRAFFPNGFDNDPVELRSWNKGYLLNAASIAMDDPKSDLALRMLNRNLQFTISNSRATVSLAIRNLACGLGIEQRGRAFDIALKFAEAMGQSEEIFCSKLCLYQFACLRGDWKTADRLWQEISTADQPRNRSRYRRGQVETERARHLMMRGVLTEDLLKKAEDEARAGRDRYGIRNLLELRGTWLLGKGEFALATESLREAVRMDREVGMEDFDIEAKFALARLGVGEKLDPVEVAERLSSTGIKSVAIARLWILGKETERAREHLLLVHETAVEDGDPYFWYHELNETRALMAEQGFPLPVIRAFDEAGRTPFPWDANVRAVIADIEAENLAGQKSEFPK
jgi:hypothetical protein